MPLEWIVLYFILGRNFCLIKMSGSKCPNCSNVIKHGNPAISCDGCRSEVHLACIGLNADDVRVTRNKSKAIKIICNGCQRFMGELGDLKSFLLSLKDDFNKKISDLEQKVDALNVGDTTVMKRSVDDLFKEIETIRADKSVSTSASPDCEEIISELWERERRKQNLMIYGMNEPQFESRDDRVAADHNSVMDMLKVAGVNFPPNFTPKILRLGKYSTGKCRPVKVILGSEGDVLSVIKKSKYLRGLDAFKRVNVSFDKTPRQIDCYRMVKKQLDDRLGKGETNLRIRYVRGCPKIMSVTDDGNNLN